MALAEQFRPRTLEETNNEQVIRLTTKNPPHVIFHGGPGSGKFTVADLWIRRLQTSSTCADNQNKSCLRKKEWTFKSPSKLLTLQVWSCRTHFVINPSLLGSNDRYFLQHFVQVICGTANVSSYATEKADSSDYKIVVISNADLLSLAAQHSIKCIMETSVHNCRFVLLTRSLSKIVEAISSRCIKLKVHVERQTMQNMVGRIERETGCAIACAESLIDKSKGNWKRFWMQASFALSDQKLPVMTDVPSGEPMITKLVESLLKDQSIDTFLATRDGLYNMLNVGLTPSYIVCGVMVGFLDQPMHPEACNNLYTTLEVEKDASSEDIRKSYRRLAFKWHPDKNPEKSELSKQKFQEISEAYQVLSNEDSRLEYDRFGTTGDISFVPPEEIFKSFFDGLADSGFFLLDEQAVANLFAGPEIQIAISALGELPKTQEILGRMDDFAKGSRMAPVIDKIKSAVNGNKPTHCIRTSDISLTLSTGLEEVYSRKLKKLVLRVMRKKPASASCPGQSEVYEEEKAFLIPLYDDVVVFRNQADEAADKRPPGDVVVKIEVKPHEVFKRYRKHHLVIVKMISVFELFNGCIFYVKGLDGNMLKFSSGRSLLANRLQVVHGAGLPKSRKTDMRGNLYVKYVLQDVDMPSVSAQLVHLFPPVRDEPGILYEWKHHCQSLQAKPAHTSENI